MIEIGRTYYFITHAYFHYIATVTAIHGVRRVAVTNVVQVHSCTQSWTNFFAEGFGKDTQYNHLPDSPDLSYIVPFEWNHPLPERK